MDKGLFVDMSGAKNEMRKLSVLTNNLANVNTVGFRGDFEVMKTVETGKAGNQTRAYARIDNVYSDFQPGPNMRTGRDLDIAVSGEGFIAVQTPNGDEAYTRAGDLQLTPEGVLVTKRGDVVLGTTGIINIGHPERTEIGTDGSVSVLLQGADFPVTVNRIKLTRPDLTALQKGPDGLFYLAGDGAEAKQDDSVRIVPGSLEGSNVNPIEALTKIIEISRQFEMHSSHMKIMENSASTANRVLSLT